MLENQDDILQLVKSNFKKARDYRNTYETTWQQCNEQYLSYADQKFYPDKKTKRSNIFVPYAFSNVEGVISRIVDLVTPDRNWFDVFPSEMSDAENAQKMRKLMQWGQWKSGFRAHFADFLKQWSIYGFGIGKVYWSTNPVNITTFGQSGTGLARPQTKPLPENFPRFYPVSNYRVYLQPEARTVEESDYVIERIVVPYSHLVDMAKEGKYDPQAVAEIGEDLPEENRSKQLIKILEYWTSSNVYTTTSVGDGEDTGIDTEQSVRGQAASGISKPHSVGEHVLRSDANEFLHGKKPYIGDSYTRLPNQVYGMGIIEPNVQLQAGLNTMSNMIIDNWNQGINRRYVGNTDVIDNPEDLTEANIPGGVIWAGGDPSKAVFPLPSFTPQPQEFGIMDIMKSMIALSSGMEDFYSRGIGSGRSNRTALGINQVLDQMSYRFKLLVKNLEDRVLGPYLEMTATLWQQFVQDEFEFRLLGEQGVTRVTPEEICKMFDYVPVAASNMETKETRLQAIKEYGQLFSQSPFTDQYELQKSFAEEVGLPAKIMIQKPGNSMTQEEEMLFLLGGQEVPVNLSDPHQEHLAKLNAAKSTPATQALRPDLKMLVLQVVTKHEQDHMAALQKIQQAMVQTHTPGAPPSGPTPDKEQDIESQAQSLSDKVLGPQKGEQGATKPSKR